MISVIICSIDAERLARVTQNISDTIGVKYELLSCNNRGTSDGICKVYNRLAEMAQYDLLCFIHEDIQMLTPGWGARLSEKAMENSTGVIGFAGSSIKTKTLSGAHHKYYSHCNVIDAKEGESVTISHRKTTDIDFEPTITVDGICLFMRKKVWQQTKFDETTFTGFHLYDLDISVASIRLGYINYICFCLNIVHFSKGAYNKAWYDDSQAFDNKWHSILPLYINKPTDKIVQRDENYIFSNITYHLIKRRVVPPESVLPRIKTLLANHKFSLRTYYLYYRYLRYKIQYKCD